MAGDLHCLIAGCLQAIIHAERELFSTYFKTYRSVLGEALPHSLRRSIFTMTLSSQKGRDGSWRENRRVGRSADFVGRMVVWGRGDADIYPSNAA